jgi:hypothetical protein
MADVTRLLEAAAAGDPKAADELLTLVYQELRQLAAARMAEEKPGQTLQATALVHEAYLRWSAASQTHGGTAAGTSSPPPPRPCAASSSRRLGGRRRGGMAAVANGLTLATSSTPVQTRGRCSRSKTR